MFTWKFGLIFGLAVAIAALLLAVFGWGKSGDENPAGSEELRFYMFTVPALAVLGGGMVSWNSQMAAASFATAAAAVLFLFGTGVLPLILCAVLLAVAILVFLDL